MKIFLIILTFLFAFILQTTSISFLSFLDVSPNLILIFIFFLVIFKDFKKIWWIIILIGFFMDLFSGLPFGTINLSLILSAYLIDWFNKTIFAATKFWMIISLISVGVFIYNLILILMISFYSKEFYDGLILKIIIEVIYNSFFAILIFYAIKKIFHQKTNT